MEPRDGNIHSINLNRSLGIKKDEPDLLRALGNRLLQEEQAEPSLWVEKVQREDLSSWGLTRFPRATPVSVTPYWFPGAAAINGQKVGD